MPTPPARPFSFPTLVSRIMLGLALPLLAVLLLVAWPWDVARGLLSAFSGRDVVQVADGKVTGVTLLVLILFGGGMAWLTGLRLPDRVLFGLTVCGWFMWLPAAVALGLGAEYGMQAILSVRGYAYCTFHVTDTGKGRDGTYVYVRRAVPEGCVAVRATFLPGHLVEGRLDGFDLPAR